MEFGAGLPWLASNGSCRETGSSIDPSSTMGRIPGRAREVAASQPSLQERDLGQGQRPGRRWRLEVKATDAPLDSSSPGEEPIRAELFGIERLEQHAESLAA